MPKLIRITTSPLSLQSLLPNQMKYMNENGLDVLMVSSTGKEWPGLIKSEGCRHQVVPMAREIAPFKDLRSLWKLYRLFRKEKPEIVHSHTPKAGLLAMLAAKMAGVKIRIHTVAGLRFMTTKGWKKRLLMLMEKLTGKAAKYVWPNSYSLLAMINKHRLVHEKKLLVIGNGSSNGVDLSRFSPAALKPDKIQELKNRIGYDAHCYYILNMGRIVKDKGIEELMEAFPELYREFPQLRLIMLGHFEDKLDPVSAQTRKMIHQHPAVIHVEWSNEVEYFMHIAHLMLHASHREGFPNTLLQAGAMNCPVVCTAIEGSVDIITDQETGILFKAADAVALQQAVRYAMKNPGLMAEYATKLRRKVESGFSQQYIHRCMKDQYDVLLAKEGYQEKKPVA